LADVAPTLTARLGMPPDALASHTEPLALG
jgi:hypothetical protein